MPTGYDIPTGDEYTPEDQATDLAGPKPESVAEETAASPLEQSMKEELDERRRPAVQQMLEQKTKEAVKKVAKEAAKKTVQAVGQAVGKLIASLVANPYFWAAVGIVVGAIIVIVLIVVIVSALLSGNSAVCDNLSGDDLTAIQGMRKEAGTNQCSGGDAGDVFIPLGKQHGIIFPTTPGMPIIWY